VISDDLSHVVETLDKVILIDVMRKTGQTVMELDSVLLVVSGYVTGTDRQSGPEYITISPTILPFSNSLIFSTAIMSSDGITLPFSLLDGVHNREYHPPYTGALHGHTRTCIAVARTSLVNHHTGANRRYRLYLLAGPSSDHQ
jgi:hypothetical protein